MTTPNKQGGKRVEAKERSISARSARRKEEPDLPRFARVASALTLAQAEAEAQAASDQSAAVGTTVVEPPAENNGDA